MTSRHRDMSTKVGRGRGRPASAPVGRRRVAALLTVLAGLVCAVPALAQQVPPGGGRGTPEADPDSARAQVLDRLRLLARPPGYDSILYVQDSVRLAEAAQGNRPGAAEGLDSISAVLISMPGYSLTEYQGAEADFRARERVLELRASDEALARVVQEGLSIEADTAVRYDQRTGLIDVKGSVTTFTPAEGDPIRAPGMVYDLNQRRGTALNAETSFSQGGAQWLTHGDIPFAAQDSSYMSHAEFTSCEIDVPHYHFSADQVKIVGGSTLVARGVRLYFADVPVFWLPFIAQSLSSGRASGLLTPRFSVNDIVRTSTGYRRRVSNLGFYWAMSDYSDALFAVDWFSNTFTSLTASSRYVFARQFLSGDINFRQYWRADGSTQQALDTRHSWEIDERTSLRVSARYADNSFVRENSFNPREVTQSIDSEGGLNRRFDWGQLSLAANRSQYLSDDRTEWTLPQASLSLTPITLFSAPESEAHFWNNMTWSGSSNLQRRTVDRMRPDTAFSTTQLSTEARSASIRSNLNLGRLSFAQSMSVNEDLTLDVPEAFLLLGDSAAPADLLPAAPARNVTQSNVQWSLSLGYQQQLIGSTTLTPRVAVNGRMLRSDTSTVAQGFVSAPSRVSLGAQLKTDIYGFFPGFGSYEMIRHKVSPSFDYEWSPESTPDDLQRQVFGARALQPRNAISVTLNQTFEARSEASEEEEPADSVSLLQPQEDARLGEPRRLPRPEITTLLGLRTSVVRYDFVQADSTGSFLQGFETTRLSNQVSSDLLRGLSLSFEHDIFDDEVSEDGTIVSRRFAPHLAQLNMSFQLGSRSAIFRWLDFLGGSDQEEPEPVESEEDVGIDPLLEGPTDESSVIPSGDPYGQQSPQPARSGNRGTWTANLSYSLQRPRATGAPPRQVLSGTVRLQPTEHWELSWRTAYDLEAQSFNDHSIRLSRDLHRWQANFDFLQTATGNWSFRFQVSLRDNRDLKFDYDQQNVDLGLPATER